MLRVMIVDDEAPARRYLRRLLQAHGNVEVIGEAGSLTEAENALAELKPNAVFMDIELGDGNGMDMWNRLAAKPMVVFVTAHASHAWRAFEIDAVDYLLKPVGAERLASAVNKLRLAAGKDVDAMTIRAAGTTRIVKFSGISAIVANGDYVAIHMAEKETVLMHGTLTRVAAQLPSPPFLKLSRSLLINLEHVASVSMGRAATSVATFSTGAPPLALGRVAAMRLRDKIDGR